MSARSIVPSPPSTTAMSGVGRRSAVLRRSSNEQLDAAALGDRAEARDRLVDVPRHAVRDDAWPAQPTASSIHPSSSRRQLGMLVVDEMEDELMVSLRARAGPSLRPRRPVPPSRRAASATSRSTRRCTSGSRTTPFGTSARPASNCGLTSTSACQPGAASRERRRQRGPHRDERDVAGDELRRERELGRASARSSARARSRAGRRGSAGGAGRGRRRARSRAPPRAGAARRVNPPVEAPRSRQSRPAGSTPNASSACASLWPGARDVRRRLLDLERRRLVDLLAGLRVAAARARPSRAPAPARGSRRARARRGATSSRASSRSRRCARRGRRRSPTSTDVSAAISASRACARSAASSASRRAPSRPTSTT